MQEPTRRTLLNTKVIDIETTGERITFFLENEFGGCFAVEIENNETDVRFLDVDGQA